MVCFCAFPLAWSGSPLIRNKKWPALAFGVPDPILIEWNILTHMQIIYESFFFSFFLFRVGIFITIDANNVVWLFFCLQNSLGNKKEIISPEQMMLSLCRRSVKLSRDQNRFEAEAQCEPTFFSAFYDSFTFKTANDPPHRKHHF